MPAMHRMSAATAVLLMESQLPVQVKPLTRSLCIKYPTSPVQELENCNWLQAAIKVVARVLRQKVIEGGRDETALLLYNTVRTTQGGDSPPGGVGQVPAAAKTKHWQNGFFVEEMCRKSSTMCTASSC